MFKVLKKFRDITDSDHIYEVGSVYPREGYEPSEDRVDELLSDDGEHRSAPLKGSPLIAIDEETITSGKVDENLDPVDLSTKKKEELIAFLTEHEVTFDPSLKKPELLKLAEEIVQKISEE